MKKSHILKLILLVLFTTMGYSQNKVKKDKKSPASQYYYYYKGAKLFMDLDRAHIYVVSEQQNIPLQTQNLLNTKNYASKTGRVAYTRDGIKPSNALRTENQYWAEIEIPVLKNDEDYRQKINVLKESKQFSYVAPYFTIDNDQKIGLTQNFYVKLKDEKDVVVLQDFASQTNSKIVSQNRFDPLWYTLECGDISNALDTANQFYESGKFASAEPNFITDYKVNSASNALDKISGQNSNLAIEEFLEDQWGLHNTGQYGGIPGIDVDALRAWDIAVGSRNIKTAVIDEGFVNTKTNGTFDVHYDLAENNFRRGYDPQSDGFSKIYGPHGVACAGIIASQARGTGGTTGVAHNSRIMSVSIDFSNPFTVTQALANGIRWAALNEADVISNSWGGGFPSNFMDDAINFALTSGRNGLGCVIAFSTGNENGSVSYPASSNPRILAVGAMSPCGERTNPNSCDGENWGSNYGSSLDLVAPGTLVSTTDQIGANGYNPNLNIHTRIGGTIVTQDYNNLDYTKIFNGTSAACPFVAGVAALVLSVDPNLTNKQVNDILEQSATKVRGEDLYNYRTEPNRPNGTWNRQTGYGLVNAFKALLLAKNCDVNDCCIKKEGDVFIKTQADVDDFYYCEVTGNVVIAEDPSTQDQITNLNGLSSLEIVGGDFKIVRNSTLENVDGLSKLRSIGGVLDIEEMPTLTSLDGLFALKSVGGIRLFDTGNLENIEGLNGIEQINGGIEIIKSNVDYTIIPFQNLTEINGNLRITRNFGALNLDIFSNVTKVNGDLSITRNPNLTDACGITQLLLDRNAVAGDIEIKSNGATTSSVPDIIDTCFSCDKVHPETNVVLSSQAQIDDFDYCEIIGNLTIQDTAGDITDLSNLNQITTIGGNLRIFRNQQLTEINGFDKITKINGILEIKENYNLETINAFTNVSQITGTLFISYSKIDNLTNFRNLETIDGRLDLVGNNKLFSVNGLNLESLQSLRLFNNTFLEDIEAFSNLTEIHTIILKNNNLNTLSGFRNIEFIHGSLYISKTKLTNLDDLIRMKKVNVVTLLQNQYLENIDQLSVLNGTLHSINIVGNSLLKNLDGFSGLSGIQFDARISNNTSLENLDGLSNLCESMRNLWLEGNTSLTDACGLVHLLEDPNGIYGTLTIGGNTPATNAVDPIIESCRGCIPQREDVIIRTQADVDNFNHCVIVGNLIIQEPGAASILNLNGLSELQSVTGDLIIKNNVAIDNFQGLSNLKNLRGDLRIDTNYNITSLDGFEQLQCIGGDLYVNNNQYITNLDTFSNLTRVGGQITVSNNNRLTDGCGIRPLIASNHPVTLFNNTPDTNSTNAIIAYCIIFGKSDTSSLETASRNIVNQTDIRLHPNPVSTELTIQSSEEIRMISIISALGHTVYDSGLIQSNIHILSDMEYAPGLYIVQIKTDSGATTKKIVIE